MLLLDRDRYTVWRFGGRTVRSSADVRVDGRMFVLYRVWFDDCDLTGLGGLTGLQTSRIVQGQ